MVDAEDVGPSYLKSMLLRIRLNRCFWLWRSRNNLACVFMRKKCKRHSKDVHVLRLEESALCIDFIRRAAKSSSNNLLAEKLTRERPQTHDVRYRLCIPPFREHPHGDDALDFLAGRP